MRTLLTILMLAILLYQPLSRAMQAPAHMTETREGVHAADAIRVHPFRAGRGERANHA